MSPTNDPIAISLHGGERMVVASEMNKSSGATGELSELEDLQRGSAFFDNNPARVLPEFHKEGKQTGSLIVLNTNGGSPLSSLRFGLFGQSLSGEL